jgi:hypothetical protein
VAAGPRRGAPGGQSLSHEHEQRVLAAADHGCWQLAARCPHTLQLVIIGPSTQSTLDRIQAATKNSLDRRHYGEATDA